MDPASAIFAFLTSLPDLIKLGQELMIFVNHASGNDPQGYVKTVGEAISQLNKAQTQEERQNAAQAISNAIVGLG